MRPRNLAGAFIVLAAAGIAAGGDQTSFEQEWPALVERIERAQIAGDFQALIDARSDCRQWLDGVLS